MEQMMNEKRYFIPEEMLDAVESATGRNPLITRDDQKKILEAALRWFSENPPIPSYADIVKMQQTISTEGGVSFDEIGITPMIVEWERRVFLSKEERESMCGEYHEKSMLTEVSEILSKIK